MDSIWELESLEDVHEFIQGLTNEQDRIDTHGLVWIATMEVLEQEGGLDAVQGTYNALIARVSARD